MRLKLKMAIHQAETTQRRVARQVRISENRLSDIVQGWVDPDQRERVAIATALSQAPDQLFVEAEPPRELVQS